ncbi:hypothetical protein NPX79_02590 [Spiroplasma endosymbiont of Anurida maritima]|uniref:hypothetical protein n=1 Tax=Spiroplasma endosymbiont of Anurida maritima TaxID=2967972 RepID=UPI0036D3587E
MKKLLMIIPTLALTVSASSYAVSCGKPLTDKAQLKNSYTYGDSELNNVIDKSLIRDLKASSILAKIFIAGRHENANYAAPSVLNNLVTMTTNPVLKLKNGDYNIEKELNRIKTYNDALGYGSPVSGYAQTATSVFYMDKNYHKKNSDYDINNVAWAHYDTGPMVNSIIKNFPEIKEIITANGFSDDFFGAINTHNTLFKKNKYNEKTKTFNIYSDFDFGKETADLNWAVYNKWSNAIISLFNAGISFFGRGTENLGLLAFGLIFPFVEQHSNSNSNFSNLIPFIWSVGKTMVNWFEKENLGKLTLLKDNYKVSIKKR